MGERYHAGLLADCDGPFIRPWQQNFVICKPLLAVAGIHSEDVTGMQLEYPLKYLSGSNQTF